MPHGIGNHRDLPPAFRKRREVVDWACQVFASDDVEAAVAAWIELERLVGRQE
jgi:hypothetical protein